MGWLENIFNKDKEPSEGRMRRLVARTKTPEGRREFLEIAAKHPKLLNMTDKRQKSALYHAICAGDTESISGLIDAGIKPFFFHDAIYAAAQNNHQAAFDLLIARGAIVARDHISILGDMACVFTEHGPEGEPNRNEAFGQKCYKGLEMLKAAYAVQEEERARDAENAKNPGPLVLNDTINVRGPLRLKPATRHAPFRRIT